MSVHRNVFARKILAVLVNGPSMTAVQVARALGRKVEHVNHRLKKLHARGIVNRVRFSRTLSSAWAWRYSPTTETADQMRAERQKAS